MIKKQSLITAVTLDLDDTLWQIDPVLEKAEIKLYEWIQNHAPNSASAINLNDLTLARKEVEAQYPQHQHDLSFYRRESIKAILKKHNDNELLAEDAFQVYLKARQEVTLFDDVIPALELLSSYYPLVSITNGNACLETIGISHYFQSSISSEGIGVCKPNKHIFIAAQHALKITQPEHILHIGDDFLLDVVGAKRAGFQTAWINRPELNATNTQSIQENNAGDADFIAKNLIDLCHQLKLSPLK